MSLAPVSKVIGPFTLSVTDQGNGVFQAAVALSASVGGGQAAGVAQFGGSLYANLSAEQVVALGFDELNKIVPASFLAAVESGEALAEAAVEKI